MENKQFSNEPLSAAEETNYYCGQAMALISSIGALLEMQKLQEETGAPDENFQQHRMPWVMQIAGLLKAAAHPPAPAVIRAAQAGFTDEARKIDQLVKATAASDNLN